MKHTKRNTVILFLITIIVLYFILKDDYQNIVNALLKADFRLILISLLLTLMYWFFKSVALTTIVKEYREKIKLKDIFKQIVIVQFFNGVTPFSSGGQPMQIYMLKKSGIKLTHSTNIIIQDFVLYQLALITCGVVAVVLNHQFNFLSDNELLRNLTFIGFTINTLIGVVLLFISFSTKFNSFVINVIIKALSKLKFIKNVEKTTKNWQKRIREFHESAVLLRQNKRLIIVGYISNILGLICYYLTPFLIIYSLGYNIGILETFVSSAYVAIIGSFVPIPGGSGGTEYSFIEFFGNFIPSATIVSAVLLIWRTVTYYFGMIAGALMFSTFKGVKLECE